MADRRRSREPRQSGERKHRRRHSRQPHGGSSDRPRGSRPPALSVDALAALNDANARASSTRDEEEEELERRRRHERRQRRRRESRAKVDRNEYQEVEGESPSRAHGKREARTYAAAPATRAHDDVDAGSDYHRERRQKRKDRSSRAPAYEPAPVDEVSEGREKPRKERRKKPKTVMVSAVGADAAAGASKGFWQNLRGGRGKHTNTDASTSYDSFYKDGEHYEERPRKPFWTKRKRWIAAGLSLIVLIIIIVAAVLASRNGGVVGVASGSSCGGSLTCNLNSIDKASIPSDAPNYLDPFTWYDTIDFNLTYTDAMVGDLPVMGLNSTWDDSAAANDLVPALDQDWGSYADRPARGVNLGGWLSIEPFIAPDLFPYDVSLGIRDEYTLCAHLGPAACASTLDKHYSSFVTESTFAEIADAGLDHIRIPFSYWAVQTYDDDPYLFRTSWRYLLRGIEWARKYGLRVNLDLHGLPGSQNGWNHSGRQGAIGWFNGTNGTLNAERSVAVHDRLSRFFAQPRYANIISHYGLANEPRMTVIAPAIVLNWTATVHALVRANGLPNRTVVVIGDGFRGLDAWQGALSGHGDGGAAPLALDVHQYVIFNNAQIVYNHTAKVRYACDGWTQQTTRSMDPATGFGPTLVAEWSQADTDCARHLNNVGWGNRWTGTYDTGNASDPLRALEPRCAAQDDTCSCAPANADPSAYSDEYKQFLLYFASAQMDSFETGWGWWYWTWWTSQGSTQWSYKRGLAAGILPAKAYDRSFSCDSTTIPDWSPGLPETY